MSAAQSRITLYDVNFTLEEKTLSQYSVRLRLLLDYRNLPYESVWLDFPDVEATAKAVGAPPTRINADGNPGYTVPFITVASRDKPTFALSNSAKIAEYIEETFPDLEGGKLIPAETRVFQAIFSNYLIEKVLGSIYKLILTPLIRALPEHTQEWFIESRRSVNGKSVEELALQDEESILEAWKSFDSAFDDLAAHLDKLGEGNYRVTGEVSYAEFELVSILNVVKRLSFNEAWKRLEGRNGGRWAKLMDLPVYKRLLPANRTT